MKDTTTPLSFEKFADAIGELCAEVRDVARRCNHVSIRVVLTEGGALQMHSQNSTDGVNASEWHGCVYTLDIENARSASALSRFLDSKRVLQLLMRVRSGHCTEWDGNNYVGRLTTDASAACDELQRLARDYDDNDEYMNEICDGLYDDGAQEWDDQTDSQLFTFGVTMTITEVAKLAGVPVEQVHAVTVDEVRAMYAGRVDATVLEVATQDPAQYWRVGQTCWLDDPEFGEAVAIDDLRYNELGLHSVHW